MHKKRAMWWFKKIVNPYHLVNFHAKKIVHKLWLSSVFIIAKPWNTMHYGEKIHFCEVSSLHSSELRDR